MKYLLHINDISESNRESAGDKAYNIALLKESGAKVPESLALTTTAYEHYMHLNKLDSFILRELKRKSINDYRWEELWDISLRIKNAFLRHELPPAIKGELENAVNSIFRDKSLAVRSSAPGEDGRNSSFAGLHESYINLRELHEIDKHIRLVWASLWSVSALLYRQELELDPFTSSMAVLIQEVILGKCSGVSFSVSPDEEDYLTVEAVHGLNQGMVDGTVEPDRWNVKRSNLKLFDHIPASEHQKIMMPCSHGISLEKIPTNKKDKAPLAKNELEKVARETMRQENYFGHPRDTEWTFRGSDLIILQSRPITHIEGNNDQREYYNNLLVSFEQLKKIRTKLENQILPTMKKISEKWKKENLQELDNSKLIKTLRSRRKKYNTFLDDYENFCIPFAHGVRLFGEIYNTKVKPDDPYEFVDLLRSDNLLSLKRNRKIRKLADKISNPQTDKQDAECLSMIEELFSRKYDSLKSLPDSLLKLLDNYKGLEITVKECKIREELYFDSYGRNKEAEARELLELGRTSYRLRDDDNIYLDGVKEELESARNETAERLAKNKFDNKLKEIAISELAEKIPEIHSPSIKSDSSNSKIKAKVKFRQLTGQPAGKGIAKGKARIINKFEDLYSFEKGEVLVCDAVEPEMTIVAPLASAVIERRGGMLIHGAIIAREYGLPCVTGIPKLTSKIKNGDLISVDGWLGIVTVF